MQERLEWKDPYIKDFEAEILSVGSGFVTLSRSAFYPGGGGQPCDTGWISCNGIEYEVTGVEKAEGEFRHVLKAVEGLTAGDHVKGRIDWERRYAHMKYHTAIHVLDGVVELRHGGKATGNQIYADKSRVDFDMPELNREMAERLISEAQEVIDAGHVVAAKVLSKEEAMSIPNLSRTENGRELMKSMDTFRVIDIEGFDVQLDGGTHVVNTKEVGRMELLKFENRGSHNKRITFILK